MNALGNRTEEHRINVSQEVDLRTFDEHLLPQLQGGVNRCIVDLSDLSFVTAPTAVNLLLFLGQLERSSKAQPVLIPPRDERAISFLSNMRFFVLAEKYCLINKTRPIPGPVDSREMAKRNILEIKYLPEHLTEEGYENWLSSSVFNAIIDKTSRMGMDAFAVQVYTELCANIFEHSQSYGFVAAQIDSSMFRLTVGDLGIGIFNSLQPYYLMNVQAFERKYGPMWNEAKALDIAFAPGVSSKVAGGREGGLGLYSVLNVAKQSNGIVICRTGRSKIFLGYWQGEWKTMMKSDLVHFPGTQLEVYISREDVGSGVEGTR